MTAPPPLPACGDVVAMGGPWLASEYYCGAEYTVRATLQSAYCTRRAWHDGPHIAAFPTAHHPGIRLHVAGAVWTSHTCADIPSDGVGARLPGIAPN